MPILISPKVRGFICVTAHPEGCAAHVRQQIDYVRRRLQPAVKPKKVLIIGASTGYGLASRITAAFGSGAATIGLFYERPSENDRCASAGWYNSAAFERAAQAEGLYAKSINGDAFSDEIKRQTVELIKKDLGQVDLVIYSLASPRRTHPRTGAVAKSCLKPTSGNFTAKTINTDEGRVFDITLPVATPEEVAETVSVMGGEDWEYWIDALEAGGVLAPGAKTVAYSYIGPVLTYPIYREGTIGKAKEHLEATAQTLNQRLARTGGLAVVSVNKALVTQASSAIPVVPLYISILYRVMMKMGNHEGCIEQIQRLFVDKLLTGQPLELDEKGRLRLDDWEMKTEVQQAVERFWPLVTTETLRDYTEFDIYQLEFLKLFGFGLPGVDYQAETEPAVPIPSLVST